MKNHKKIYFLVVSVLVSCGLTEIGHAATATTTFKITAEVTQVCSVSADTLAFGSYDPSQMPPTDATSKVSVTCTNGTAYQIGLDWGLNPISNVRRMTNGDNRLNYNIYQSNMYATLWGNLVDVNTVSGTGNGLAQDITTYGRIEPHQTTPSIGSYSDTIGVTVTY